MTPPLGIIEGYFGRPWSWDERASVARLLAGHGYGFFIYAPKADAHLRRRWREPHPPDQAEALAGFAAVCRDASLVFGVGLSPFEAWLDFDGEARRAMADKLAQLDELGVQALAIQFDDMKGDAPDLAARQAEIIGFCTERTSAQRIIVCPTYYTDDPVLDRVFGARPPEYLEALGRALDPKIEVFWTGEEVCAQEVSPGHLERVAEALGRKPTLWDNYPVNDGPRMSLCLHLRAFTGRPAAIGEVIAAHAVNPALQPTLSCIPALTLETSYRMGDRYEYGAAFREAARKVVGEALTGMIEADLMALQDWGRDRLGERGARLKARYGAIDHPAAREIVSWLDGAYDISAEELQTQ